MNLKETGEGYMGGLGESKGKGEMLQWYYDIKKKVKQIPKVFTQKSLP